MEVDESPDDAPNASSSKGINMIHSHRSELTVLVAIAFKKVAPLIASKKVCATVYPR